MKARLVIMLFISLWIAWLCTAAQADNGLSIEYSSSYHREFTELSGIARATETNQYWVHNDGRSDETLWRIDQSGNLLQTVKLPWGYYVDWEDVASFTLDNQRYIMVADIGDNLRQRKTLSLYFFAEPTLAQGQYVELTDRHIHRTQFKLPKPADAEAATVITRTQHIIIADKAAPTTLYALDLSAAMQLKHLTVESIAELTLPIPEPLTELNANLHNQPVLNQLVTGMDVSPDEQLLVLTGYQYVWQINLSEPSLRANFSRNALTTLSIKPTPRLLLIEGVTVQHQQEQLLFVSEFWPAGLAHMPITP